MVSLVSFNTVTAFHDTYLLAGLMIETGVSFSLSSCEFYCVNFTHADLEQRWKALLSVILVLAGKRPNQAFFALIRLYF